eukprot:TRINITY_DN1358_c0_g1_i2.p1 TRINITY_DN1358_c0_g1~~TRINITY_DN1358_c0_g1_i2.p1  ORF type:complete len:386 (+),score=49.12 TRINITY_DN1358_c0_g1_i2:73-1158(+)
MRGISPTREREQQPGRSGRDTSPVREKRWDDRDTRDVSPTRRDRGKGTSPVRERRWDSRSTRDVSPVRERTWDSRSTRDVSPIRRSDGRSSRNVSPGREYRRGSSPVRERWDRDARSVSPARGRKSSGRGYLRWDTRDVSPAREWYRDDSEGGRPRGLVLREVSPRRKERSRSRSWGVRWQDEQPSRQVSPRRGKKEKDFNDLLRESKEMLHAMHIMGLASPSNNVRQKAKPPKEVHARTFSPPGPSQPHQAKHSRHLSPPTTLEPHRPQPFVTRDPEDEVELYRTRVLAPQQSIRSVRWDYDGDDCDQYDVGQLPPEMEKRAKIKAMAIAVTKLLPADEVDATFEEIYRTRVQSQLVAYP